MDLQGMEEIAAAECRALMQQRPTRIWLFDKGMFSQLHYAINRQRRNTAIPNLLIIQRADL
jgi:hypothetical protein